MTNIISLPKRTPDKNPERITLIRPTHHIMGLPPWHDPLTRVTTMKWGCSILCPTHHRQYITLRLLYHLQFIVGIGGDSESFSIFSDRNWFKYPIPRINNIIVLPKRSPDKHPERITLIRPTHHIMDLAPWQSARAKWLVGLTHSRALGQKRRWTHNGTELQCQLGFPWASSTMRRFGSPSSSHPNVETTTLGPNQVVWRNRHCLITLTSLPSLSRLWTNWLTTRSLGWWGLYGAGADHNSFQWRLDLCGPQCLLCKNVVYY